MRYDARSIFATVIYLVLLFLILVFMGFKTPLPLPSEKGFIIDFGVSKSGKGVIEPAKSNTDPVKEQVTAVKEIKERIMTQEIEEAPSLPVKKKVEKENQTKITNNHIQKEIQKQEEKKEERKPNPLTMYKGSSGYKSEGQGQETSEGNKGQEDGINAGSHFIGNSGEMGVADVGDRVKLSLPNPEYNYQKEGIVVVKVRVDRSGNVIYALPGVKGSSTLDNYLLEAAKKAALASKFNPKSEGKMYDEGTITYRFKLE